MIKINASSSGILPLGHQGENLALAIAFPDAAGWASEFGGGAYALWHQRPGESTQYPAVLEMQGDVPVWVVSAADTAIPSDAGQYGRAELRLVQGDVVVKSCVYSTMIAASLTGAAADPPEPAEDWTNRIVQAAADAAKSEAAAAKSAESAAASAENAQTKASAAEASAKDAAGSAQDAAATAAQVDKVVADFTAAVAAAIASVTATGEEQVAAINAAAKTAQDELAALAASGRDEVTTAANAALQAIAAAQERALSDIASARTETLNAVQAAQDAATDEITSAKSDVVSGVTAEGEAQKGAVESAGAAQLEAVNAAGSTQKQAVNDAGAAQTKAVNDAGTTAVADVGAAKDSAIEEINAAIPDIPALALDDSQIDGKGWSSKHIVDMLCPAIEEVGNPIQFYPVTGYPLDIVASWTPTQEGNGDPSPENIRPIKGRESVTITRQEDNQVITLTLPETIYGGEVDVNTGEGKKQYGHITIYGTENWIEPGSKAYYAFFGVSPSASDGRGFCTHYPYGNRSKNALVNRNGAAVFYGFNEEMTIDEWKSFLAAQYAAGTPIQIAYELAEPIPFTATGGATLPALEGVNTILTDADSVTVKARADPNHVITELQDALASITETKEG